jgi:hypothetical protein
MVNRASAAVTFARPILVMTTVAPVTAVVTVVTVAMYSVPDRATEAEQNA